MAHKDINKYEYKVVVQNKMALSELNRIIPEEFDLIISLAN